MSENKRLFTGRLSVCIFAVLCCALWGSAFPCIKIGYSLFGIQSADWASQILFAGIRFTLAGVMTVAFASCLGKRLLLPEKTSVPKICVLALFQTALQYIFFYIGLAHTQGTKASVINSVSVFFSVIISAVMFRQDRLTLKKAVGCVIGFAGVVIINYASSGVKGFAFALTGEGFIVLSSLSYALSCVFMKKFSRSDNTVMLSGYQFILGGLVMTAAGVAFGGKISQPSAKGAVLVLYLAFVSAAAYTLWSLLLSRNDVSSVAVYGFMTPVFGCLLSAVILKEELAQTALQTIISLILVCVGIYLVNSGGNRSGFKNNNTDNIIKE